jgi:hypothetical protein
MKIHRVHVITLAVGLASLLMLGSCAILSQRSVTGQFDGLDQALARNAQTNGIIRLLLVHGIGLHTPGYADGLMQGLAPDLGLIANGSTVRTNEITKDGFTYGLIRTEEFIDQAKVTRLKLYELTWSPTVTGIKTNTFAYDESFSTNRLLVNRSLKTGLMDASLSDAVLYTGKYKDHMQYPIMRTVQAIAEDGLGEGDELVAITHSLGSRMTFDTLNLMNDSQAILHEKNYNTAAVQSLIRRTTSIFMLANQLPLLGLADVETPEGKTPYASLKGFINRRTNAKTHRPAAPEPANVTLNIIAFSDPNDLLSYPLKPSDVLGIEEPGAPSTQTNDVRISNVRINVARIGWFFVVANPSQAHTGYLTDSRVDHLIAHGSP